MSLEAACVKPEPDERGSDSCGARRESTQQLTEPVHVKEDPECGSEQASCVKAELLSELYADHEVKDDLVLGPERPHRPDAGLVVREWALGDADGCPLASSARGGAQLALRDCSVRLERLPHREAMRTDYTGTDQQNTFTTHTDSESDSDEEIQVCEKGACNICGEKFALTSDLKEHVMTHIHIPSSAELEADTENEAYSNADPIDEKGYVCDICDEPFPTKLDLMGHVAVHIYLSGMEEEEDTNNDSQSNLLVLESGITTSDPETMSAPPSAGHEPEPPKKPNTDTFKRSAGSNIYICDTCSFSFKRKNYLIRHMKVHLKTKSITLPNESKLPYACQTCDKKCRFSFNMRRHEVTHISDKPYCCDVCKKTFKLKFYVKRHIRSLHSTKVARPKVEKHFCQTCNKTFSLNSSLEKHRRSHTGVKPYFCEICKKGFYYSSDFSAHKRIHTGEKPYTCISCFKKFRKVTDLYRHERVHSGTKPHSCDICDKRFSQLPHLTEHMRVHTGEKPYSCRICKQQFRQSSSLNRHFKRTHGGEIP